MARSKKRAGNAMIITTMAMLGIFAMAAFAIDVGMMMSARTQLQGAADAAALAGMLTLRETGSKSAARSEAIQVGEAHRAGGDAVRMIPADIRIGRYDYASRTFTGSFGFGPPAIQVEARRTQGSPGGPLGMFFGRVVGFDAANVAADAVASIRRRDLVILQDRSGSFVAEFPDAQDADRDLVTAMEMQGLSGDQVGVVTFANAVSEVAPLTDLGGGGAASIRALITSLLVCVNGGPEVCGTYTHAGLNQARQTVLNSVSPGDAERIIVLVSDGIPCVQNPPGSNNWDSALAHSLAVTAADAAEAAGINIFVITLDQGAGPGECFGGSLPPGVTSADRNAELVRGFGRAYATPNASELDDLIVTILQAMPFHLVE